MAQQLPSFLLCAVLFLACHHASSLVSSLCNETDRQALLSFKSMLSGSSRESLTSWNDSIHFCKWPGIACGQRHHQRVVSLSLGSHGLSGSISPAIANLTFLKTMDLSDNQLHGPVPQDIGRLRRLRHLNLSMNFLGGGIPATLSGCFRLQNISMASNMLTSEIPPGLSNCFDLHHLNLMNNDLTGHIPPALTNLSFLTALVLRSNQLNGNIPIAIGNLCSLTILSLRDNLLSGTISPSIGKLPKLAILDLASNQLTGAIPSPLWNLSSLSKLFAGHNSLSGSLPANVGQLLPLIQILNLDHNQLHGPIPMSLSNASHLERIEIGSNRFSGTIPPIFGALQYLEWIILPENLFEANVGEGWSFMDNLSNCTSLSLLFLEGNNLGGMLPRSIANLSINLQRLAIAHNQISGNISPEIANLGGLTYLDMGSNLLTGSIPASIGMLQNLCLLDLNDNKLSEEIPSTLGNLTHLIKVYLNYNQLSETIPASLGNCQNLDLMDLQSNKLSGGIPKEILNMSTLSIALILANNSLSGPIPSEIGNLRNLGYLDVRMNKLSDQIPSSIGECQALEHLLLGGNHLNGSIPFSLSALRGIQELDLSQNNLSGNIPDFLQDFHFLFYLNLSFNNFEGAVPRHGVFANISAVSVIGNNDLCGGSPEMHLPDCLFQSPNEKHDSRQLILIISIAGSFLFLFLLFCSLVAYFWMQKSKSKHPPSTPINEQEMVSYADLVKATNGFSEDRIIGSGSFAKVYKGILHDNDDRIKAVAIKVLNLQLQGASKSFVAECEALRNMRHRNLLKILTVCSSVDFRGNEFKALVLEFMANGSLDGWLHPKDNEQSEHKRLSLMQRLNIAMDVAMALDYFHNYSETPIIHCDLKPSNVLLDNDMTAHVGDFGLARMLKKVTSKSLQHSTSSVGLKGTVGYIPPEYGVANRVSTQGDVYSYGILLLEMLTAKSPTDGTFMEGPSLRKFVEMSFPHQIIHVIDPQLLSTGDREEADDGQSMNGVIPMECLASVLHIGILCSNELPAERLEIQDVIRELNKIRVCILKKLNPGNLAEG